jgi:hypothetical protein
MPSLASTGKITSTNPIMTNTYPRITIACSSAARARAAFQAVMAGHEANESLDHYTEAAKKEQFILISVSANPMLMATANSRRIKSSRIFALSDIAHNSWTIAGVCPF